MVNNLKLKSYDVLKLQWTGCNFVVAVRYFLYRYFTTEDSFLILEACDKYSISNDTKLKLW